MSYSEGTAQRIREALATRDDVSERKMFGGLCFMVRGNMAVGCGGAEADDLMVRVGKEAYTEALLQPHAQETSGNFRPMRGIVWVKPAGFATEQALQTWIDRGLANALSLPAK